MNTVHRNHLIKNNYYRADFNPKFENSLNCLVECVCSVFNVCEAQLKGGSRLRKFVIARHIYFVLAYNYKMASTVAITSLLDQDHSILQYAIKEHEARYMFDKISIYNYKNYAALFDEVESNFRKKYIKNY